MHKDISYALCVAGLSSALLLGELGCASQGGARPKLTPYSNRDAWRQYYNSIDTNKLTWEEKGCMHRFGHMPPEKQAEILERGRQVELGLSKDGHMYGMHDPTKEAIMVLRGEGLAKKLGPTIY